MPVQWINLTLSLGSADKAHSVKNVMTMLRGLSARPS